MESQTAVSHENAGDKAQPMPGAGPISDTPDDRASPTRFALIGTAALATAACGGDGAAPPTGGSSGGAPPIQQVRKPASDAEAARFLLQADLAVSTAAIAQLRDQGYEPWLTGRMQAQNDQSGRQFLTDRGFDRVDASRHYNSTATGDFMIWSQLMTGGNTVRCPPAAPMAQI